MYCIATVQNNGSIKAAVQPPFWPLFGLFLKFSSTKCVEKDRVRFGGFWPSFQKNPPPPSEKKRLILPSHHRRLLFGFLLFGHQAVGPYRTNTACAPIMAYCCLVFYHSDTRLLAPIHLVFGLTDFYYIHRKILGVFLILGVFPSGTNIMVSQL